MKIAIMGGLERLACQLAGMTGERFAYDASL
jgi:hypothetical protein